MVQILNKNGIKEPSKDDNKQFDVNKEFKKAEKEDLWIVRIVEIHGRNSKGTLNLKGTVAECNLIEWENLGDPISVENELALDLSPFEIKTYKVRFT